MYLFSFLKISDHHYGGWMFLPDKSPEISKRFGNRSFKQKNNNIQVNAG